jgi:hypothetical protein
MSAPTHYDASAPSEEPLPAVATPVEFIIPNCVFFAPRTRRGHGPGIICLMPLPPDSVGKREPSPVQPSVDLRLVEEGFAVVGACINDGEYSLTARDALKAGTQKLASNESVDGKDKIAVLGELVFHEVARMS